MREKAVSWRIERSSPFLVYRASRIRGKVTAGFSKVFLIIGPTASLVKPRHELEWKNQDS